MRPKKIANNPWNPLAAEIQTKYTPPAENCSAYFLMPKK
jgi:hypothetical protein